MAVLTFKSEEYRQFPEILKEYSRYLTVIKGNAEKTVCEYLLDLRTFFRFLKARELGLSTDADDFEKLSISDLTLSQVTSVRSEDIIEYLMFVNFERKNSPTTRMRKLSALRSLYKYICNKKGYMEIDPCANVDAPKPAKTLPKYMTLDECMSLLDAVKSDVESPTRIRDFAIITLFLNTGMRLSELCGLNLQSLSSDLKTVRVLGKGNKERMLYINDMAREALEEHLRQRLDAKYIRTSSNALFISTREQRISQKTVQWMVHKYLIMAGLGHKKLSVHKLRHTAATLMYQTGEVDIRVLKEVLGHEQLNTTQIYTHVVNRNIEMAIQSNPLSSKKRK